jgi:hypothetical protein
MATVSEVAWRKTGEGLCPGCYRQTNLGVVNVGPQLGARCIDCCFGPPIDFWFACNKCSWIQVNDGLCEKCGAETHI